MNLLEENTIMSGRAVCRNMLNFCPIFNLNHKASSGIGLELQGQIGLHVFLCNIRPIYISDLFTYQTYLHIRPIYRTKNIHSTAAYETM